MTGMALWPCGVLMYKIQTALLLFIICRPHCMHLEHWDRSSSAAIPGTFRFCQLYSVPPKPRSGSDS